MKLIYRLKIIKHLDKEKVQKIQFLRKSVDLFDREGSSPSIPKMKLEKCKFLIILKNFVNSFIFSFIISLK